jgi:ABC-type phosphate transport system substrate-binding protein
MRKVIVAAATAAALGTLGLTAVAQAQPAAPRVAQTTAKERVVAGIPASFLLTQPGTETCTWGKTTGLPGPVSANSSSSVKKGCELEIEGVWPTPGTKTVKTSVKASGKTTTWTLTVTVLAAPCETDAVGVGSDTITPLTDQLSSDYNGTLKFSTTCAKTASAATTHEESWDAVNPVTGQVADSIPIKTDCSRIPRPNGSSAGVSQLATFTKSKSGPLCTNFARSSRARKSTDPPFAKGGVAFVSLAGDAVTWSAPSINTFAPASLTPAQLTQIWSCTVPQANHGTGLNQWGDLNPALTGSAATTPIAPFLPQSGSGTLSFWETAIGVSTPGPCVTGATTTSPEENEGVDPRLNSNPGTIFIYSVGDWIAQVHHAPKCLNSGCTANSSGVICKHVPGLDQFWCDLHGTMRLGQISGISPTTGSGSSTVINPSFPSTFDRTLYDVVPFDPGTADNIPGKTNPVGGVNLEAIFGASGFDCTSKTARADITAYGFLNIPTCGTAS